VSGAEGGQRRSVLGRFLEGFTSPPDGGAPPIIGVARARLSAWTFGAIGLGVGCATGLLLVLILFAVHGIPTLIAGFAAGTLIGGALAVTLASRYPIVRKGGGIAILLLPLLLLAAPFLLIALAVAALLRTAPSSPKPASAVVVLPRRRARSRS
jgi:hypothetical protein